MLERVDELKAILMMKSNTVYFSQILLQCKIIPDSTIPTACTNGLVVRINPEWFMSLEEGNSEKEQYSHQLFVLFHEAMHPALLDLELSQGLNPRKWNEACDHFNNLMIKNDFPEIRLPTNAGYLHDSRFSGMTKEEIYAVVVTEPDEDNPLDGDLGDGELSPEEQAERIIQVQKAVQSAAMAAEQMGCSTGIPNHIKRYLDDLYNPQLPWNKILENCISEMLNRDDYSYARPNPHYLAQGFYIPTLYSESLGKIGYAFDTSCSVTDADIKLYLGAIHDCWNRYQPSELEVVSFDTSVSESYKFTRGDDISSLNFRGSGGTDVFPVFEHFRDSDIEILVIFTDMYFKYPTEIPPYPVVWIAVNNPNSTAPFGSIIHISN